MCWRHGLLGLQGPIQLAGQWGFLCPSSALGDLALGFEFRIRGEELPVLVLNTHWDWGKGPAPLVSYLSSGSRRQSIPWRSAPQARDLGDPCSRDTGASREENGPFFFSCEMGLFWTLSSLSLLTGFPLEAPLDLNCKLFPLGGSTEVNRSPVCPAVGIWPSGSDGLHLLRSQSNGTYLTVTWRRIHRRM